LWVNVLSAKAFGGIIRTFGNSINGLWKIGIIEIPFLLRNVWRFYNISGRNEGFVCVCTRRRTKKNFASSFDVDFRNKRSQEDSRDFANQFSWKVDNGGFEIELLQNSSEMPESEL